MVTQIKPVSLQSALQLAGLNLSGAVVFRLYGEKLRGRFTLARMRTALTEVVVEGIDTNTALHIDLFNDSAFQKGGTDIHYLQKKLGL